MSKEKVLFLCTGNAARSQMAEALLNQYAGDQFDVYSAGFDARGINPYTFRVMKEIDLDLAGQWSKDVNQYLGRKNFSHIITLCEEAEKNCPTVFLLSAGRHEHWNIEDPAVFKGTEEEILDKFRQVRNQIDKIIQAWLQAKNKRD